MEPGVITVMRSCGDGGAVVRGLSGAVFTAAGMRSQGKKRGVRAVIYRGRMVVEEEREP